MKLLAKSDLDKAKANDKAKEIAEGLKISRRVDGLRELQAKEEELLAKFRHESLLNIHQNISEAETEKEQILSEVKVLREEKSRGLKDLEARRLELSSFEQTLNELEKKLHEESKELETQNEKITINLKISQADLERARTHKEEAERLHGEADQKYKEAQKKGLIVDQVIKATEETKENILNNLRVKEEGIVLREKTCQIREEELEKKAKEISTLNVQVRDMRATLEREMKRITNG